MASFIAGTLAKKAFNVVAKDRNILIPLDDIGETSVLTDKELKKKFAVKSHDNSGELKKLKAELKNLKDKSKKKSKKPKTNLEKVLERR